ncbi:MAG: Wzz/FepE/Etk N-terminal domain-containing protein [Erysipelotrichaceae bacterium]|nr:Wzz/FepE/Etk N-terminal domain-containing protein [Erysipelotrichaceae bacterium]
MVNEQEEVYIDLGRVWQSFKKCWGICVAITLISTVVAFLISAFLLTEVYTATSRLIIVQQQNADSNQAITYNDVQLSQKLVNTYKEIIRSEAVLDKVSDNLNIIYDASALNGMLEVNSVNGTEVIDVSVTSQRPDLSADIANEIVDVFQKEVYQIMNVSNVTVLNEAKVPTQKSGPSNAKNGAIGMMVGIMISGLIVVVKTLKDTKVKTEEEVRAIFDYPIIGVIPNVDLSKYNKGGADND